MKTLLILAGGFGTRLRSIIPNLPKPLAPVSGKPFLRHFVDNCFFQGARDFVFLLHYKSEMIQEVLFKMSKNEKYKEASFTTIIEEYPMGTGGSISNAIKKLNLKKCFLVINADTWISTGIREIQNSKACSLAAVKVDNSQRYGKLLINNGIVVEFIEKDDTSKGSWINAGLYHLHPNIFENYFELSSFSLEKTILKDLAEKSQLNAIKLNAEFIDIGIPSDYEYFVKLMNDRKTDEY